MNDMAGPPAETPPLRLVALDTEDLAIVSAHLQDAIVRVGDMAFLPQSRRFALVAARFDWLRAGRGPCERCSTGLHFERVSSVKRIGFEQDPDAVLNLLAIMFLPGDAPSGTVMLSFSGGGALRLEVECLEAAVSDLGPRWTVDGKPCPPDAADG